MTELLPPVQRHTAYSLGFPGQDTEAVLHKLVDAPRLPKHFHSPATKANSPVFEKLRSQAFQAALLPQALESATESEEPKYRARLERANLAIKSGIEKHVEKHGYRDESIVEAVTTFLDATTDKVSAPVILSHVLTFMQENSLHDLIEATEPAMVEFAIRSRTAFEPKDKKLSLQQLRNHVTKMFRPFTLTYLRNVILLEGQYDNAAFWREKALAIKPRDVTGRVVKAVLNLNHYLGSKINSAYKPTYYDGKVNPIHDLTDKGMPLAITPEFETMTNHQSRRSGTKSHGWYVTRNGMVVAGVPGVPIEILENIKPDIPHDTIHVDMRLIQAINDIVDAHKKSPWAVSRLRRLKKHPTAPPIAQIETRATKFLTDPKKRIVESSTHNLEKQNSQEVVPAARPTHSEARINQEEQPWLYSMLHFVSTLLEQGDEIAIDSIKTIKDRAKDIAYYPNRADAVNATVTLFRRVIKKLSWRERQQFGNMFQRDFIIHDQAREWVNILQLPGFDKLVQLLATEQDTSVHAVQADQLAGERWSAAYGQTASLSLRPPSSGIPVRWEQKAE